MSSDGCTKGKCESEGVWTIIEVCLNSKKIKWLVLWIVQFASCRLSVSPDVRGAHKNTCGRSLLCANDSDFSACLLSTLLSGLAHAQSGGSTNFGVNDAEC